MEVIKTIYEIRYPKVLRFADVYPDIINPYFNYPNAKYGIFNEGNREESIKMTFPESKHVLIFSYDRISYQFDGTIDNLVSSGSNVEMVFNIFSKLKEAMPFVEVSSEALNSSSFFEFIDEEDPIGIFQSAENLKTPLITPSSFSIIKSGVYKSQSVKLQYGNFEAQKDILNFNLFDLDEEKRVSFLEKEGILLICQLISSNSKINKSSIRSLGKMSKDLITSVFSTYE